MLREGRLAGGASYGLICVPPQRHIEVLPPVTLDVTFCGNRVSLEVMKLEGGH